MKKIAMFLAILLVAGTTAGFSAGTVETFVENRSNSDLHPVADVGMLAGAIIEPIDPVMDMVMKPIKPVKDPIMDGAKKVVNTTYDIITLRHMREKK
jgi:hypothetical protein